jgi:DNA mismatch endonuclease, patch repair protein
MNGSKLRSPAITKKIMSSIPGKDTRPELLLRKALWVRGFRYRKHYKIKGKPDVVFVKAKLAVFCDGDFWHGNNWRLRGLSSLSEELESYSRFWREKILRNIARDKEVNEYLNSQGWMVLRFWSSDIQSKLDECVSIIERSYHELTSS